MTDSYTLLLGGRAELHFLFGGNLNLDPDRLGLKAEPYKETWTRQKIEGYIMSQDRKHTEYDAS